MAIKKCEENGKIHYEVYLNGFDARGVRVQRRKRGLETLRKAEVAEFELRRELAQLKERAIPYRWHEWFDQCMKEMKVTKKPSTVYNYQTLIKKWVHPHWENLEIRTITRLDVHELLFEKCSAIATPNSRKTVFNMLKRLFQMALEEGAIDRNPCLGLQVKCPEVEQKVLTSSEVEIFLREAKVNNHRFYPIWAMALMTGMRSGELFALRWMDVDFDARTISITRQWTSKNGIGPTKTQKSRIVPISDDLLKFLRELKLRHGTERETVLPHFIEWENGEQARITREFCQALGITVVKFHDLRATFITNLLACGEALARVMSIVGHGQLKTTNGYLRKAGVEVKGATDKLGYKLPDLSGAGVFSIVRDSEIR